MLKSERKQIILSQLKQDGFVTLVFSDPAGKCFGNSQTLNA